MLYFITNMEYIHPDKAFRRSTKNYNFIDRTIEVFLRGDIIKLPKSEQSFLLKLKEAKKSGNKEIVIDLLERSITTREECHA